MENGVKFRGAICAPGNMEPPFGPHLADLSPAMQVRFVEFMASNGIDADRCTYAAYTSADGKEGILATYDG